MTPISQRGFPRSSFATESASLERRGIPFDYAFRFKLQGRHDNVLSSILTVSIEATFIAVSIGYGVVPEFQPIIFGPVLRDRDEGDEARSLDSISLKEIVDGLAKYLNDEKLTLKGETGPEAVLKNGLRLNPDVAELLLQGDGETSPDGAEINFERAFQIIGAPPENIQFTYAIFDEGSGRQFQNEPILNTAGLGSANGERPFRYFAQPLIFRPRSTLRMDVTEKSDFKGDLHISLHGYKVLGGSGAPTAATQGGRARPR